jgi:hypothetical protein
MGFADWSHRNGKRVAKITISLVVVAGALAGLGWLTVASAKAGPVIGRGGCSPPSGRVGTPGAIPGPHKLLAKLREGQLGEVDFGRGIKAKNLVLFLDVTGTSKGTPLLHVRTNVFRRDDDARLDPVRIVPRAALIGRTAQLSVCFGRKDNRLGDPGTYRGSITLDDSRMGNEVTVPITVTMQYIHGVILWWLFLPVIIPGSWALWVLHTKRNPADDALVPGFVRWLFTVGGVVSVVTGSVAAVGVYIGTYLRDPTWGSSALQVPTLFGAMFSAFVTTAGITQLSKGQ